MPQIPLLPQNSNPSAIELLRLPQAERDAILAAAALQAEADYSTISELTDFEAFGKDDLHGHSSDSVDCSR